MCRESYDAAKDINQPGHVPMLVWHDEEDSFECSGSIPGISVINSLSKTFPYTGRYAGGMILRLYYGIGFGIAFTRKQVQQLLGKGNTFATMTRMYESPADAKSASQLPHKQRREQKKIKHEELERKKEKRKNDIIRDKSHNVAYIKRDQGSKALMTVRKKKRKIKKKLTFNEAAQAVIKHAKSPSMCTVCEDQDGVDAHTHDFVVVGEQLQKFYRHVAYDMAEWRQVKGGIRRPRPKCPSQGMGIREPSVKFDWKPGMKEIVEQQLVNHTANSVPCESIAQTVAMDGRWSDLFCPSKTQVKNFVMAHFARKKKAAQHALEREGKRSYTQFSLSWLKKEVVHRGLKVGNRRVPGCTKLLEDHDDQNEGKLTKYHSATDDNEVEAPILTYGRFKKSVESRKRYSVPLIEWYRKECAYQEITVGSRQREGGMCRLLYQHFLNHGGPAVKRHDDDHTVVGTPTYALHDEVEVFWKGKWYAATVIKCYPNHTWDVRYPPDSDQVFCTRLPSSLLRKSSRSN